MEGINYAANRVSTFTFILAAQIICCLHLKIIEVLQVEEKTNSRAVIAVWTKLTFANIIYRTASLNLIEEFPGTIVKCKEEHETFINLQF